MKDLVRQEPGSIRRALREHGATLIDFASDPVIIFDHRLRVVDANELALQAHGYERDEFLMLTLGDLRGPQGPPLVAEPVDRIELEDGLVHDSVHRRRGGRTFRVACTSRLVQIGGAEYVEMIVRDTSGGDTARAERRAGEARYQSLFQHMPSGCAFCRMVYEDSRPVDFVYLDVNPAFKRLTGVEDVVGRKGSEVLPDLRRDNPEMLDIYASVAAGDEPRGFEVHRPAQDNWFAISVYSPARDHFVAVFDDVTDKKRAEKALAASERFLNNVIEQSPHAMWVSDAHGTLLRLNQACRELLAITDEDVVGKYNVLEDNLVEEQGHMPLVRSVYDEGKTVHFALRWRSSDLTTMELEGGPSVILEVTMSPVLDAGGRVIHAVIQHVDITERERALEELRDSEQQVQAVFSAGPTGIVVTSHEDGRLIDANEAFVGLFGVERANAVGKHAVELGMFLDDEVRTGLEDEVLSTGRIKDREIQIRTQRAGMRTVLLAGAPLERAGEPCFVWTITDISERKALEDELQDLTVDLERRVEERTAELGASNAELEAFSYSVSHDLRAPLRHISGFAGMLAADYGDALGEQGRVYIEKLTRSVREMGTLIDELLEFSRAGRVELSLVRVDMGELVQEVRETLEGSSEGRDIEWNVAALPEVWGDRTMLRQVWENLLGNAIKYTRLRERAQIAIEARETPAEHEFTVRDNGIGFEMKYADKLFGVFQRLQADPRFEGVGIGLANVRRVVVRHGGRTWAEGELDVGAVFGFTLPRRRGPGSR
jgi:PAS domain S-box-containing protein